MAALLCVLLLSISLEGCAGGESAGTGTDYKVYFATPLQAGGAGRGAGGASVESEDRTLEKEADPLNGLMELLLEGPRSDGLESPFPNGVRQLSAPTVKDGVCRVNLSEAYGGLSGAALTIADYCITLTLCQVEGVDAVTIDVEGEAIPYRNRQLLRAGDVFLSGGAEEPVQWTADLFFLSSDGYSLGLEQRVVSVSENDTLTSAVLGALLSGSESDGLSLPFPKDAHLLSAWVEDGVCYVNFDAPFLEEKPSPDSQARLLLYAIVDTLCRLPEVSSVHLLVEGEAPDQYGGVPTGSPLEANYDLVKQ